MNNIHGSQQGEGNTLLQGINTRAGQHHRDPLAYRHPTLEIRTRSAASHRPRRMIARTRSIPNPACLREIAAKAAFPFCRWPTITGITGLWALIAAAVGAAQPASILEMDRQPVADRIKHRSHRPSPRGFPQHKKQ